MRKIRFFLLVTVGLVVAAVILDFLNSKRPEMKERVLQLESIPSELVSQASRWHWSQSSAERQKIEIFADSFRQSTKTHLFDLEGVELRLFNKNGKHYDQVISRAAQFNSKTEKLYSEGKVTLILGINLQPAKAAAKTATRIHSSGVTLEAKTGICTTDSPTVYEFEGGSGHSVGAFYDSVNRHFRMDGQVYLRRDPPAPGLPLVEIYSQGLHYYELDQRVDLVGDVKIKKGRREAQAEEANIYLSGGNVHRMELTQAQGMDREDKRTIYFEAGKIRFWYTPLEILERVTAERSVRLRSVRKGSTLTTWGERLELLYTTLPAGQESELSEADVRERAGVEVSSVPGIAATEGSNADDFTRNTQSDRSRQLRRIRSEWLHLTMRKNKQEADRIETFAPGTLEIIPSTTDRWQQQMKARRIRIDYGVKNRAEKLLALGDVEVVSTPSSASVPKSDQPNAPLYSWSQNLEAEFDHSGEAIRVKQWENFRFRQATREGSAEQANLDLKMGRTQLLNQARIWNQSGSVNADTILLEENTGRMEAQGNVSSIHREDTNKTRGASQGIFTPTDPVLATAENLLSEKDVLHYQGGARLWQGSNRIEAHSIAIDRSSGKLTAQGNVQTTIRSQSSGPNRKGSDSYEPMLVYVRANSLHYDGKTGKAVYQKQAQLIRENLTVLADEIEGFLDEKEEGTVELQIAFARGSVRIYKTSLRGRDRHQGFGTAAEYRPAESRIELTGLPARFRSADGRETRGPHLTYHLDESRVLVDGKGQHRTYSYHPGKRQAP